MSEEFKSEISKLHAEFDYVICDTPPWDLFVDAKIVSRHFDHYIYIVCNQLSSFRDIDLFEKDIKNNGSISFSTTNLVFILISFGINISILIIPEIITMIIFLIQALKLIQIFQIF